MKRTALLPVAALTVLATGLAGCSGQASPSSDKVTLETWTFKQSHVEALTAIGEQCFPDGDVTVKVEAVTPDDAFTTKVQAGAQTKDLPDVLMAHAAGEDWLFAQSGILMDLTDFFDEKLRDRFTESSATAVTISQEKIDGSGDDPATTLKDLEADHIYSMPLANGTASLIMANKTMLEAAGVATDKAPETWEQWVADMTKVKAHDPDNGGLVAGLQVPQVGYYWLFQPMSTAYLGIDDFIGRTAEAQTTPWNSPGSMETLERWNELTPLWTDGVFNLGIDQADQLFAQGKAAYDLGGTFTVPFLVQQGMDVDDLLIFQAPAPEGAKITDGTMLTSPLVSAGITTTSKHPEEAKKYLECLSSEEGAATFMNTANDLASAKVDPSKVTSSTLKALASIFDREDATVLNPPLSIPIEPPTGDAPNTAVTEVIKISAGETTPQAVADLLTQVYRDAWAAAG